jgi:hypothetical protein
MPFLHPHFVQSFPGSPYHRVSKPTGEMLFLKQTIRQTSDASFINKRTAGTSVYPSSPHTHHTPFSHTRHTHARLILLHPSPSSPHPLQRSPSKHSRSLRSEAYSDCQIAACAALQKVTQQRAASEVTRMNAMSTFVVLMRWRRLRRVMAPARRVGCHAGR